jgi:hypothetical protein
VLDLKRILQHSPKQDKAAHPTKGKHMAKLSERKRNLIEGRPALIVIDIQVSTFVDPSQIRAIDNMPGYKQRMAKSRIAPPP